MRPVFERLMAGLVESLAPKNETAFEPTPVLLKRQIPPDEALRHFIEKHPGHLPEALLCEGNCAELGSILRGEKDAVQVLVRRHRRGIARSILWRRPLHQPLARRPSPRR